MKLPGYDLEVRRRGSGAPLLVLHGGGGPITQFPFAERLAQKFELIEPVHPGFAGTPIPDHFDNLEDLVYLYLDLMDALGLEKAVVLGNSMGGWLASEIAVRNSSRIARLILVNAVGVKVGGRDDRDIADVFSTPAADLLKMSWYDPTKAPDPSKMTDDQLRVLVGNRVALSLYGWDPYLHNPKLKYRLHRIKVPTLFLWGVSDGIVKLDYGRGYSRMIPGSQFIEIAQAGHAPHVEQPEVFARHVIDFASK